MCGKCATSTFNMCESAKSRSEEQQPGADGVVQAILVSSSVAVWQLTVCHDRHSMWLTQTLNAGMPLGVEAVIGEVALRQLQSAADCQTLPSTLAFDHPTAHQLANMLQLLPELPPLGEAEVLLCMHAVGLNFRNVLDVLGAYPGDCYQGVAVRLHGAGQTFGNDSSKAVDPEVWTCRRCPVQGRLFVTALLLVSRL